MYKYKLTENTNKVISPEDMDPVFLDRITKLHGDIDMENDFFTDDLDTYYKTSKIDKTTGGIEHEIIKLASFDSTFEALHKAYKTSDLLANNKELQSDDKLKTIIKNISKVFNQFRTHLRKSYPEQYDMISKTSLDEENTTGSIPGYQTPKAFKKKLNEAEFTDFQKDRIDTFDSIADRMNSINILLSNAKNKTITHYNENPNDQQVLYPTDLINDYMDDIELILKQEE